MPTCSYCQTENPDEAPLCRECGRPLPRPVAAVASGGQLGPPAVGDCQVCHSPVPPDAQFCPACGTRLGGIACASCGATGPPDAEFCIACGKRLTSSPYANFWRRFAGALVDFLVISTATAIVIAILSAAIGVDLTGQETGMDDSPIMGAWNLLYMFVIGLPYFIPLNARGGTLGKRAAGVRLQDARTGENIGLRRSTLRYFVAIGSYVAMFLGFLWCIWDPKKQTWHDKAAGSVVVRS